MSSRRRSLRNHSVDTSPVSPRRSRRSMLVNIEMVDDEKDVDYKDELDKSLIDDDDVEDVEDDVEEDVEEENGDEENDNEPEEDDDEEDDEDGDSKKRSRSQPIEDNKRLKPNGKETSDYEVVDDEYNLPSDEKGDLKIDKDGVLQGGRQYRIKAFTVHGKQNRLYMLSTELARLMGFRDSYLFFQKHRDLYKYITTDKQKLDLVERGIMPLSYKLRTIGLITAKSLFREFGATIIKDGKQVIDDYYEAQLVLDGGVNGELAVPPREYHPGGSTVGNNELSGLSTTTRGEQHLAAKETASIDFKKFIRSTPENWIYNIATSTVHFNHFYYTSRPKFIKDPYTNVKFLPQQTQPSSVQWAKSNLADNLEIDTVMNGDLKKKIMGLLDLEDDIFADCVDDEVKAAIIKQREFEKQHL